jgi:hypothetical protein
LIWFLGSRWYQKNAHIGFFGAEASLFFLFCFSTFSLVAVLAVDLVSVKRVENDEMIDSL